MVKNNIQLEYLSVEANLESNDFTLILKQMSHFNSRHNTMIFWKEDIRAITNLERKCQCTLKLNMLEIVYYDIRQSSKTKQLF